MKAKQVIEDIKKTLSLLDTETDPQIFRILFVSAVTLTRSVGHVLEKIDSTENPKLRESTKKWWNELRSDKSKNLIFHEFIEKERNTIIKEYRFNHENTEQDIAVPEYDISVTLPELMFCPMIDGQFAGEDCRDLLTEAVSWWEKQIETIQKKAQQSS